MSTRSCENCRFRVDLTLAERKALEPDLRTAGVASPIMGACVATRQHEPLLVDRYLQREVVDCPLWAEGGYSEHAGAECPNCREGSITLVRHWSGVEGRILLQCSNYSDCNFVSQRIGIETLCPTCSVPLILDVDEELYITCESCRNYTTAPITLRSRPYFLNLRGKCVHGQQFGLCVSCATSAAYGTSEVEQELKQSIQRTLSLLRHEPEQERPTFRRSDTRSIPLTPVRIAGDCAVYQDSDEDNEIEWAAPYHNEVDYADNGEITETRYWMADYNLDSTRSAQDGWFYDDDDNEEWDDVDPQERDSYFY